MPSAELAEEQKYVLGASLPLGLVAERFVDSYYFQRCRSAVTLYHKKVSWLEVSMPISLYARVCVSVSIFSDFTRVCGT